MNTTTLSYTPLAADADLVIASASLPPGPEIVFVEGDVAELPTLQQGMGAGREFYVLDPAKDGLAQMASILEGRSGISAIHLVTHGTVGTLDLGATTLTADNLPQHQAELQAIGHSLSADGDILLYGCDVGAGAGQAFVDRLAAVTGADVAASDNLTGAANLGGDWSLEVRSGDVEAAPAVSAQLAAHYLEVLSLSNQTVNFETSTNFVYRGDYKAGAASDLTYAVNNNSSYVLKIDGGLDAVYSYSHGAGNDYTTFSSYVLETSVKISFQAGNLFTATSLVLDDFSATTGETLVFKGYDASNAYVATAKTTLAVDASGTHAVNFAGSQWANIASIKITQLSSGSSGTNVMNAYGLDDLVFSTIQSAPPTVTDARISISGASGTGGAYKIGDTVTATWNNTAGGDNNAGVTAVTVDFSQFGGGSAVSASNSSGTWTATYAIVAGAIDGTNKNVSVTATTFDSVTTADTTNATVDNIAPTVADAHISISGASGTGGAFKIGDTVTATWDNTAGGDNNSDTIAGVKVDFSQFGGGSAVTATNSSGTWTATYAIVSGAIDGVTNRNVSVTATDNAGNTKATADTTNATVDNVAPAITLSSLAFSADTGASSSDFVTKTAAQTITATLSGALAGGDVLYGSLDNGSSWTDVTSKVSVTSLSWNGVTLAASDTLELKVTDAVGNEGAVTSQAYVLDTSTPGAPSTPDMTSGTDTGSSTSDNLTGNTTPTFTGTAESGATVTLYDTDGTTVLGTGTATGGSWTITSSTLSSGSHTLTAKATDTAGNESSASSGLGVEIDTAAPTGVAPATTTVATASATSTATVATLSATDVNAITFSLATGNGTNDADNGSFTIAGTSLNVGASSLTAGAYHVYLAATDAAGNVTNWSEVVTVVDAPSVSSIVRTGGASATVDTSAASVDYTVTFDQSVTGVDVGDFALTTTGNAGGSIASVSGSGTTYTVTVDSLTGDGTVRLDLNGSGTGIQNSSNIDISGGYASGSTYTLDHTPPTAPAAPDMTAGTDSGSSSSDDITSSTTPTFTGTAESGATVTLYDTDGTTVLGTGTATGGNWSITSSTLSSGSHTLTAKATDAANNVSLPSSGLSVTIDATAPTVGSVAVPSSGYYLAGQVLQFTVNFGEAVTVDTSGGTPYLALDIGGSTAYASYASGSGSSALVFSYTVQAGDTDSDGIAVSSLQSNGGTLRDTAGNNASPTLSGVGSTSGVLVDTTAPTVNSVSVPADGWYVLNENLDFTVNFSEAVIVDTSGGTPRISVTLDTGGTVYADYLSGSGSSALVFRYTVGSGVEDGTGIAIGALSANGGTLADAAGNAAALTLNSVASTSSVLVDAIAPTTTVSTAAFSADTGSSASDFITNTAAQTVSGTLGANLASGEVVEVSADNGASWSTATGTVGQNTWSLSGVTLAGSNTLKVAVVDAAGNFGTIFSQAYILDTSAPALPSAPDLAASSDDGASTTDNATSITTPTFNGTAESGSTVTLYDTDGTTVLGTGVATGGNWSITSSALSLGLHTVTATATDTAGNEGLSSSGLDVTIQVPGTSPPAGSGRGTLTGTAGDDVLDGGAGRDTLIGHAGNDTYYVDNRHDTIVENPGEGTDTVFATCSYTLSPNVENLTLVGTDQGQSRLAVGNDLDNVIIGNGFDNWLEGLAGADTLTGGAGADRFIYFAASDGGDVITDFSSAEGDRIVVRQADADAAKVGIQHFTFIGTAAFSGVDATGQLRFDSAAHMLYGSTNADGSAEFAIELQGVAVLTIHDLLL